MEETTLFFVRHADVDNPHRVIYGLLPGFHLSKKGKQQAKNIGKFLAKEGIVAVYTSPIERAVETADIIGESAKLHPVVREELIESRTWQPWQGQPLVEEKQFKPSVWRIYLGKATKQMGGETLEDLASRMESMIVDAVREHAGEKIALVSHGDPIKALRFKLLGESIKKFERWQFPKGSILRVSFAGEQLKEVEKVHL